MSPKQLASIIQFQEPSCRTDCDLGSYIEFQLVQEPATRGVLQKFYFKNFTKFTGKHLCQSLLFNTVFNKA